VDGSRARYSQVLTQVLDHPAPPACFSLARLVATLGVLAVVQAFAVLHYGTRPDSRLPLLPTDQVKLFACDGDRDRIYILGISAC